MRSCLISMTLAGLLLTACQAPAPVVVEAAAPAPEASVAPIEPVAIATLVATAGNTVEGEIHFIRSDDGLRATGRIQGLGPMAAHGFHIHQNGDCSAADGSSAGGHFNPAAVDHGTLAAAPHHAGDMPNLQADAEGVAVVDGPVSSLVTIGDGGEFDIIGRGLIVHADADDYVSQPTGNAGARLACAVIQPAG